MHMNTITETERDKDINNDMDVNTDMRHERRDYGTMNIKLKIS
jgi:hypothetical protein